MFSLTLMKSILEFIISSSPFNHLFFLIRKCERGWVSVIWCFYDWEHCCLTMSGPDGENEIEKQKYRENVCFSYLLDSDMAAAQWNWIRTNFHDNLQSCDRGIRSLSRHGEHCELQTAAKKKPVSRLTSSVIFGLLMIRFNLFLCRHDA